MEQLSSATACPTPFLMAACIGVASPRDVEASIHRHLSEYRVNSAREFFRVSPSEVQYIFSQFSDETDDLVQTSQLDEMSYQEEIEVSINEQKLKVSLFLEQCADPIHWPTRRRANFSEKDFSEVPF